MLSLSGDTIARIEPLTSSNGETALIFDDSMYSRNRSKTVEMLARFKDHATGAFYKGFRMLTMDWSDGHSFVQMDFALLSSMKSGINGMADGIDKRSHGYKRGGKKRFVRHCRSSRPCWIVLCRLPLRAACDRHCLRSGVRSP